MNSTGKKMRRNLYLSALLAGCLMIAFVGACGEDEEEGVEALKIADLDSESDSTILTIDVPSGAQSVAVVIDGAGSNLVTASRIVNPAGEMVFSFFDDNLTNRTDATDGLYTLLIPSNPDVKLDPGQWQVNFVTDKPGGFEAEARVIIKDKPASAKTVDVNLFFVGVEGLDAETAKTHENFQGVLGNVEGIYSEAGISFGTKNYVDVTGDNADALSVIDSIDGESSELARLFKLSEGQAEGTLSFFFVSDIQSGTDGFPLLGLAGGVPGPPGVQGTARSGIAVNMSDFAEKPERIEFIMAHEAGHFLGLYHTTERNGKGLDPNGITGEDPISDTALCPDSADADGDKVLKPSECEGMGDDNLMFWTIGSDRKLTAQQGTVMVGNPLVK